MLLFNEYAEKAKELKEVHEELCNLLVKAKERIIRIELEKTLSKDSILGQNEKMIKLNFGWLDEIMLNGETITLKNERKQIYRGYTLYFEKEYSLMYLGFKYKDDIFSPHYNSDLKQLSKYSEDEISEILEMVKNCIFNIRNDIDYLKSRTNIEEDKYYYKDYDFIDDGEKRYNSITEILNSFKAIP